MTEKSKLEGQSRRKFLKTSGAVGAAVTGVAAFGGNAAAQNNLDLSQVNVNNETGRVSGLIVIEDTTIVAQDVLDVEFDDINVDIRKVVTTEGGDVIRIILNDVLNDLSILNDSQVVVDVDVLSGGDTITLTDTMSV